MTNKIIFGADLIKVLEKEYKLNKLGEVPTKYKNGITTIDFIYGKEKDIDDLKYDKPYIEFTIDNETDGFISGTMYPNGGVEGIQFDSWDDLKYFMKNAKWTESKKSARKSLKEGIDVKIVYADDTPSEYIDDVTHNDILDIIEESPEVYKIFDVSGSKKKLVWSDEYGFERAYESNKSDKKSLKEGINDELIATSSDGESTLYLSDERQANHGKDPHYEFKLGENGYFTRYVRCDDNRCEKVVFDWIKEFNLDISKSEISRIIKLHESKKSMKKNLKESKDSDFFNGIAKEYHFSKDEKTRYKDKTYISAIGVFFDRINDAIKTYGRNSDEEYNALNDCWEVISSAKQNGWNVDYEEDKWNKIAMMPNFKSIKKSFKESIEKDIENYVFDIVSELCNCEVETLYNDNGDFIIKIGVWNLYGSDKADLISSKLDKSKHLKRMLDNYDCECKLSIYDIDKPSVYTVNSL